MDLSEEGEKLPKFSEKTTEKTVKSSSLTTEEK